MLIDNRNYKLYDCLVQSYVWKEETNILILSCQYLDRGATKIALRKVCDSECLELLINHVIEYVVCSYDAEKKACCYEIHLRSLSETAKVWAGSMEFF
ncbi:hypothetical protein [Acetivibrio ethanolgignens]|uniref:Uncharacterized protein n=1 Tax=Acetivibrio ethanolgignens TaxID=290052 RepID=A0A0V8QFH4_9FIRM|nr:hypothetical protein [Acetivibrio ethanolgignens]KSV59280.1 hypothetical protein ASU35_09785 [Acetivibrio ethanolgignens]